MEKCFIIFDSEYASWDGFLTAPKEEKKKAEVVQIAALKVNAADLTVREKFCQYIKPHFTPKLTDYFIKLTGITDDLLDEKGIDFLSAYKKFVEFCGMAPCYSHAWNPLDIIGDGSVFDDNLALWQASDLPRPRYKNIAPWFREQYTKRGISISRQASGEIATLLNCQDKLPQGLQPHNALYDVYSILAGLRFLDFKL